MADRKISDLTALTAPASGDYLPIVDISEAAAASKNKRVTIQSLFQGIPVNVGIGTSGPTAIFHAVAASSSGTTNADGIRINAAGNVAINMGANSSTGYGWIQSANWGSGYVATAINPNGGNVGIGTTAPTTLLDVNADTVRVRTARTPASATATGATGEICWDANYIYVAVGTNTWKRAALSTW